MGAHFSYFDAQVSTVWWHCHRPLQLAPHTQIWASHFIDYFSFIHRKYTISEFERFADDFARKRFGSAGQLPQQMVEVSSSTHSIPRNLCPEIHPLLTLYLLHLTDASIMKYAGVVDPQQQA